jgi:hypothetical protein
MGGTTSVWPRGAPSLSHDLLRRCLPEIWPLELIAMVHSYTNRSYRHIVCIGGLSFQSPSTIVTSAAPIDNRYDIWSCHIDIAATELQAARLHSSDSLNRGSLITQLRWFTGLYPPSSDHGHPNENGNGNDGTDHYDIKRCLPRPRQWPCATLLDDDNVLLVTGGLVGSNPHRHTDAFSMVNGKWLPLNTIPSMNMARYDASSSVLDDGRWIVSGGLVPNGRRHSTYSVEAYNPRSNSWTRLPGMIKARAGHASCVFNGLYYCFGGTGPAGGSFTHCEVYNPITDK